MRTARGRKAAGEARIGSSWILIAEPDPVLRALLCSAVCGQGYPTEGAADVTEARALIRQRRPSLAAIELDLPGGPALPVAELADLSRIPVLLMTRSRLDAEALCGRWPVLLKPVHLPRFFDLLSVLLRPLPPPGTTAIS